MLKQWLGKIKAFEQSDPRLSWGIPLALATTLGVLLLANLLIVDKEDPNASIAQQQTEATSDASADQPSPAESLEALKKPQGDQTGEDSVEVKRSAIRSKKVIVAQPLPGEDEALPDKPEAELVATRLFEVGSGHWQLQQRPYVYTELSKPRVLAVLRQKKLFMPLASGEPGHFSYRIENDSRLTISQEEGKGKTGQISFDRSRKFRYALQLTSLPASELHTAWPFALQLVHQGFYVYWNRSEEPRPTEKGEQFLYKLRVGFYESEYETLQLAKELAEAFPEEPMLQGQVWPVLPDYGEVEMEVMDFGVQRSRPWCIDLASYRKLEDALSEMAQAGGYIDMLYLTQKKDSRGFLYQIEGGFYANRTTALKALELARRKTNLGFKGAKAVKRRYKITADRNQGK